MSRDNGTPKTEPKMITVPLRPDYEALTKYLAGSEQRPLANYIRKMIFERLQEHGFIDEEQNITPQGQAILDKRAETAPAAA
jgi:ribosomal protein S19E (S16A)